MIKQNTPKGYRAYKPNKNDPIYKCQFCSYEGSGWLNKGQTCPKCGKDYDWQLAQDSEE